MNFTITLTDIAFLIIALGFLLLVIYIIPILLQLKRTVKSVDELTSQGKEVIRNANTLVKTASSHADEFIFKGKEIMSTTNNILKTASSRAEDLGGVVKRLKETSAKVFELVELISTELRRPIITLISVIIGLNFGLKYLRKKKKKREGQ